MTVDAAGSIAAHAQNLTVHFDAFTVTPPGGAGQSTIRTVAFRGVLEAAEPVHLSITHHIRGQVSKGSESRVVVTAILGPSTAVREFPYDEPFDGELFIEHRHDFVQTGRQPYTGMIAVLVEQRESDDAILVAVDGLDVTIALRSGEEGAAG